MLFSLSKSASLCGLTISEWALLIFGILLVAGLVGEYREGEWWKKRLKFFEMLVIIGVLGELLGDGGIFLFSSRLQTIADAEIAQLSKDASEANKEAWQAKKETAEIWKSSLPRVIDPEKLARSLRAFPGTSLELDAFPEAERLALKGQIELALTGKNGAGWKLEVPNITDIDADPAVHAGSLCRSDCYAKW